MHFPNPGSQGTGGPAKVAPWGVGRVGLKFPPKRNVLRADFERSRCAGWRATVHNHETFKLRFGGASAHPLLSIIVENSQYCWALDLLHLVDYHGVASHALANVLVSIIRDAELPGCSRHADSIARFALPTAALEPPG